MVEVMAGVNDFEQLGIYKKSRELAKKVYEITRIGEFKYDSRFVQQIRAAAGSVSDNIAEGVERQGNKEFKNFLYIAKGSAGELRAQLNRAFDVGFIDVETYSQMYNDVKKMSVGILHMIQCLKDSPYTGTRYSSLPSNPSPPSNPSTPSNSSNPSNSI